MSMTLMWKQYVTWKNVNSLFADFDFGSHSRRGSSAGLQGTLDHRSYSLSTHSISAASLRSTLIADARRVPIPLVFR